MTNVRFGSTGKNRDNRPVEEIIRVLHVDDEVFYTELTKECLADIYGDTIVIDSLTNPEMIFEKLKECNYDVIVSDYKMPGMDGLELLSLLRKQNNDIPFIMFTGRGREEVAIKSLNLGADYYLKKGGDPDSQFSELGHIIKQVVHHKRTENKLIESEQKFRLLTEQSLLGIAILQDGLIKYVNESLANNLEYTVEEVLAWPADEFVAVIHPEDRPFVVEQAQKKQFGKKGIIPHYSYRLISKTGKIKWADNYSKTIMYEGRTADLVTIIDITHSKRIEEVLLESEERYRQLVETMNEGLLIQDRNNLITYVNDSLCKMFQYSREELLGTYTNDYLDDDSRKRFEERTKNGRERSSRKYELTGIRKDGSKINMLISPRAIVSENGKLRGSFAVISDISDRKQAELALQESEARYRSLFENVPIGLYRTTPDGRILAANPAMLKMVKYPSFEELSSLDLENEDQYPPKYSREEFKKTIDRNGRVTGLESELQTRDGSLITVREYAIAIRDESGNIECYEGSIENISERKKIEEELRDSEARYRTLFENVPIGLYRTTPDGKILAANPAMLKMLKYSTFEEFTKLNLEDESQYPPQISRQKIKDQLEREGSIEGLEVDWRAKDGSVITVREYSKAIRDETGNIICYEGSAEDITERKRAEEALRESEKRFVSFMENLPGVAFIKDFAGRLVYVNDFFKKQHRLGYDDWYGKTNKELFPPEVAARFTETDQQVLTQRTPLVIEQVTPRENEKRHWLTYKFPVPGKDDSSTMVGGIGIDITDRKRVEEALRESESKFRSISESAMVGVVIIQQDKVPYVNEAAANVLYKKREKVEKWTTRDILEVIHPEDRMLVAEQLLKKQAGNETGIIPHYAVRLFTETGELRWVELYSKPIIYGGKPADFAIVIDITDRKKAEYELHIKEKAIASSINAIAFADLDGTLIYTNPSLLRMWGYKEEEIIGKMSVTDFWYSAEEVEEVIEAVKVNDSWVGEGTAKRKDGTLFDAQVSVSLVRNEAGESLYVVASIVDITEKKRIERELRLQKEELSDFAHFIAHDLGNSLSTLTGFAQLFKKKKDASYTEKILKQAEYMRKQLERSLKLADAGLSVEKTRKVDLNHLVDKIADVAIPKNIEFSHNILPTLICDYEKISQVFKNLFENAIIHGKPKNVAVKLEISEKSLRISVINDGEMIPPEAIKRVFRRGYTTKKGPHSGLGLTIVKKIVEAHGWEIDAQSDPEHTCFYITLPREE
ncbi:MAG: PAS domain S-box protein [Candidatus Odinarchaeota archaeon]